VTGKTLVLGDEERDVAANEVAEQARFVRPVDNAGFQMRTVADAAADLREVDYELLMRRKYLDVSLGLVNAREKEVRIRIGAFGVRRM
jgi:hypothetical protein